MFIFWTAKKANFEQFFELDCDGLKQNGSLKNPMPPLNGVLGCNDF